MSKFKELILTSLVVFAVIILIYGMVFFNNKITGKVSFELESNYEEGQALDGILKIALKEGELIPASSKIVFENAGEIYEYELNNHVSEDLDSGEFYIEGKSFFGTGEGYGIKGEKTIYPTVYFTLDLLTESSSSGGSSSTESEEISKISEEILEEEVPEELNEEETSEESNEESEEVLEEVEGETSKEGKKDKKDKKESKQEGTSEELEPTITGNIISGFFSKTFNFFLRLTGQVSLELENEIDGEVSGDNDFVYELKKGQTAEISSGSVKTDSEELSNNEIDLDVKGNKVIVTTTYSKTEQGFGENYLGNNARKTLAIDLSKLNFTAEPGELKVGLVYENEEIISLSTLLVEGEISVENETEINLSTTNIANRLTEEEREILVNEFGNVSLEITKAEKTSQGIIVRFEIKDFWVEHSYDSEISDEKLEEQINKDKTNFLKDLARKFSKQEIQKQEIEGLVGIYDI
tara:strand:- start:5975 stop:7375 length:1401 start_codon:yes stop_codon:yes gene_type:complete